MGSDLLRLLVILLLGGRGAPLGSSDCKSYDERSKSAGRSLPSDRKVVCSNMELHQVLAPDSFPNRTVTLIYNNNKIKNFEMDPFLDCLLWKNFFCLLAQSDCVRMPNDEVLNWYYSDTSELWDLRSNMISRIEPGAFLGLPSLKRLDLSNNSIGCLNVDLFKGLASLIRLNLSGNKFSSLSQGTFDSLVSLKALEFQTPYLLCDCNLLWLLRWTKEKNIAVKNTKCSYPSLFRVSSLPPSGQSSSPVMLHSSCRPSS
ncbi:hypothetical protein Q5P01_002739 [Channa striata]|uniref:LRRCT domain-containing protein n=1 Tax=Channa striata TaxID=64152 RepID=A0AA88T415_CHASR|nr:hypothetical protein Q5P01_002739 [Channa striata]